jgi:phage tail tape-measure protein
MPNMASARKRVNWTELKAEYVSDPMATYHGIAAKYGVSASSVQWHSQHEGWFDARREHASKVVEKLSERNADAAADALAVIHRQHLTNTRELREMIAYKLKTRDSNGKVVVRSDVSIVDLARVASAYNQLLESDRIALGADVLPETHSRAPETELSDTELFAKLQEMLTRHPITPIQ